MIRFNIILLLLFVNNFVFSQTFNLDAANNGSTHTTCNATLYDSGGSIGDYSNSEDYTITFCSGTTDCMELSFVSYNTESGYDYLYVYDGPSTTAPLLITLNGSVIPPNIVSSASCITLYFHSDGSVTYPGFEINISCTGNCYVPPPPPTNNDPCSAEVLSVDSTCNYSTYTNVGATNSTIPDPICAWSYMGGDIWFEMIVPASGWLTVELAVGTVTDAGMAIYSGPDCNNITEILCDEPWAMPFQLIITPANGLAGQTVWVRVWEQNNDNPGTMNICAFEPPPQLVVDPNIYTPQQLIEDILITGCLEAFNVQFDGDPASIGYFTNGTILGMQSGLVMSSGEAADVSGAPGIDALGWVTSQPSIETDLLTLVNSVLTNSGYTGGLVTNVEDVSILEFDFVPSSDTTEFVFVFASEEYDGFECSMFNDIFAFLVSGPGITGPYTGNSINVAVLPGTTVPVTITSINNGTSACTATNTANYLDQIPNQNFNVQGYTTPLTATMAGLIPCETYHIKFIIADAGDQILNTYVFFEEGSFTSGGQVSMNHVNPNGNQDEIVEGCESYWVFTVLDTTSTDSILVDLIISGTADTATDLTNFQSTFWIPAGQITDTLYYSAIFDNITEGVEYIVFSLSNGCPCSITTTSDTIWIFDNFDLNPTITPDDQICANNSFTISTTVNPLIDPTYITYTWSTGDTISSITETPAITTIYTVTITQLCQPDTILSMTLIVIPDIGTGFSASDNSVCIGDPITFTYTDTAGVNATYTWTFTNGTPNSGNTQGPYTVTWAFAGTYDISLYIDDSGCTGDSTIQITVNPNPIVTLTPTNITCYGFCNGEIAASPNGTGIPYIYLWDDPASQITEIAINLCPGTYNVTFTNVHGCIGTDNALITEPTQLTSSVTHIDVLCFGQSDGSATVIAQGGTGNHTYLWDANTGGQTTPTATNLGGGIYSVTVIDDNGCTSISSVTISEPTNPLFITLFGTDVLCFGGSDGTIDLTVTGGTPSYGFSWSNSQITEDIDYASVGTYCVTVTDANLCTISDCITINEPTQLTYTTSTSPTTCFEGSDGIATVNVANGTPPYTYLWSNGDMVSSAVNISAGTYTVIVTDNNGCSFATNMTVNEPDRVVASTNADMWICIGETATLNAAATGGTPGYTFHWSNGGNTQSINVSPTITTQYCMHAEDSHGCISNNYCVTVNVYLPISIVVISDVDKICPGEPVTVSVVVTGGNGNYIYTLDNTTIINSPYTDYPTQSLSYTVTVSDDCGSPTDFGTVSIIVLPMPPNSFAPDITAGCQPFTVQFIESSSDIGQTYNWNFDDENSYNTSSEKNPTHIFEESGVYDITLTVTDTNGCINVDVVEDLITVYPKPVAKFEPDPEIASVIKPVIYFNNLTIGAVDYHWFFGDGDSSLAENPKHIYAPIEQTYIVELRVESDKGCKDTVFLEVRIKDEYTFYAPTAFSPDGDLINDEFFVVGHGIDERNFNLIIYDRWGEVIFEADDPNAKWNGNVQGKSSECQLGTYTWLCKFKDVTGVEHSEAGAVTIIR